MRVHSLYKDFFKFLERITPHSDKWALYNTYYYKPHKEFLDAYFPHFTLINFSNLKERVEAINPSDYSLIKNLITSCPPELLAAEAYERCVRIVSSRYQPAVFLMIGFFSPDAFVINFKEQPIICFGMERFKDFSLFKVLFAHEYAHFLLNSSSGGVPEDKKLKWLLISEGLGTHFSKLVFPEYGITDHLFFRRDRLNWCQKNESRLKDIYLSGKYSSQQLIDFYKKGNPELNLPPLAGKYIGYKAIKKYFAQNADTGIDVLLSNKKKALSVEL